MNAALDASSTDAYAPDAALKQDAAEHTDIPAPTTFGTWIDVTPFNANLTDSLDCGNYGATDVRVDPNKASDLYVHVDCQGIWKSTDYGMTWTGPINTGTNGAAAGDCAGGLSIASGGAALPPILYQSCKRGTQLGLWISQDGGVDWQHENVAPFGAQDDAFPPAVDPYDSKHLLLAEHAMNVYAESTDGGKTWHQISIDPGMSGAINGFFAFINTGNSVSTRATWLWLAQGTGGTYGTWRTVDAGVSWTRVDSNEHALASSTVYQPDTSGVLYMAGVYSALGWGVLRSTDYGKTWAHIGNNAGEALVFGTASNIYSIGGGPIGIGGVLDSGFELASQPGTGSWAMPTIPSGLTQGCGQVAVTKDSSHNHFVCAGWNGGIWHYIEP